MDYLPESRVLIPMGHANCFSSNPGDHTTVVELDPVAGAKVWEARYGSTDVMAYRGDWADPCELFANAAGCPEVVSRLADLGL